MHDCDHCPLSAVTNIYAIFCFMEFKNQLFLYFLKKIKNIGFTNLVTSAYLVL